MEAIETSFRLSASNRNSFVSLSLGVHFYRFHSLHSFQSHPNPSTSESAQKSKMCLGHICGLARIFFQLSPVIYRNILLLIRIFKREKNYSQRSIISTQHTAYSFAIGNIICLLSSLHFYLFQVFNQLGAC